MKKPVKLKKNSQSRRCCKHSSDCAVHNAPALDVGPCDCGAFKSKTKKAAVEQQYAFLLVRTDGEEYDVYVSAVVISPSARKAKFIHPNGNLMDAQGNRLDIGKGVTDTSRVCWVRPTNVKVTLIGPVTNKHWEGETVICNEYSRG